MSEYIVFKAQVQELEEICTFPFLQKLCEVLKGAGTFGNVTIVPTNLSEVNRQKEWRICF